MLIAGNIKELVTARGRVRWRSWGEGEHLLVGLHGYGQDGGIFHHLAKELPYDYQLVSLDLPFHGGTQWKASTYTVDELAEILTILLANLHARHVHLIGYSLGGRLALCLAPRLGERLQRLSLLAPAGLGSRHDWLVEHFPRPLRGRIGRVIQHPNWLLQSGETLRRMGVLDRYSWLYMRNQLKDRQRRNTLIHTWQAIANFNPRRLEVQRLLREGRVPINVILGKHDQIIYRQAVIRFFRGAPAAVITELDTGHQLLRPGILTYVLEMSR